MKTGQNKLETQIKEQLNAREIQPSQMAWDRLDAMLSVAEEKKMKRFGFLSYQSIAIAASVLVLLSLGLFLFNQKETIVKPENNVVIKEENNKVNGNDTINRTIKINENELNINSQNQEVAVISNQQSSLSFNRDNQKETIQPSNKQQKEIDFQDIKNIVQNELQKNPDQKMISSNSNIDYPDQSNNEIVAVQKITHNKKIKINANSLLSQVDGELEQSFRDKVLTKINKNYQEVKVVLVTRNQE